MLETQVQSLLQEDPLEKEMATHSSILAWRISWTEKPGRLQSMGSQRLGHNWATFSLLTEGLHSLKIHILKPSPQYDGICRQDIGEDNWFTRVESSWEGLMPVWRNSREPSCPFHHVRTQQEDGNLCTRKKVLNRHWICQQFDLRISLQHCEE